ncbi:MAG TPA: NAD-binding protein [Candidatus Dormibacteraeota bacterium]|nr:NAD-binding protein [Candidatus Dormibacteraeota bacterium]
MIFTVAGTTIICGLERLSLRIASALIPLGENVIIVAVSPNPDRVREATATGATFVEGRGADLAHLPAAGLSCARCLVLTENTDLANLHTALAAREINPELRVVIRMFNAGLADRASRLLPNSRVLSSTAEAAPYFAADALGGAAAPARHIWGRHLLIYPPTADSPVTSAESALELGDGHVLGHVQPPPLSRRRGLRRLRGFRRAVAAFFDFRLGVTLGAIAVLVGASAVVFRGALHLSWIDALYFTVTTASTTGFGDINLLNTAWWVKLYGVGFMFAAALSLATLFALAADAVIGARILEALGVPRGRMRSHVVVVGLGNAGYRIVQRLLDAGVEVAAAEISERNHFVALVRRDGVPVLVGDGRHRDSLSALSVEHARAVVAATNDDLANLEAALTARELNTRARIVARLFDQELARRAQEQLGIHACYSVSGLATPAFVAAALGDGVLSTIEAAGHTWLLGELSVEAGSPLDGSPTAALEQPGALHVLAVRESNSASWRPGWPERLSGGNDVLIVCRRERWELLCGVALKERRPPKPEAPGGA